HQLVSGYRGEPVQRVHVCVVNLVVMPSTVPARVAFSTWVAIDESVVVNVRYVDIRDPGIGDVDAIEIAATHSIPRNERLTESKRAPSVAIATAEAESQTPARPAEP